MLKQDLSENTTFCHSTCQWWRSRAHCSLRHWWFLDNGATSLPLKRRQRTVETVRSKLVAVLHRLNTVDEAVRSIMTMRTRCRSSQAVVILRSSVPTRLCVQPFSLHWFHTCLTVIASCPVRAAMSWYDKPASRRPTILLHLNALTCWNCALSCRRGIPALTFTFQLCLEALHWLSKA